MATFKVWSTSKERTFFMILLITITFDISVFFFEFGAEGIALAFAVFAVSCFIRIRTAVGVKIKTEGVSEKFGVDDG